MSNIIKQIQDNEGNNVLPITHVSAVKDSEGTSLPDILNRDYPTTSKTPVEGSSEVSLVTRGEKFDYDKVNNATDVTGASDIANLKYVLFNGTNEQFKTALDSYVNERIRSAFGSLLHNLDKSGTASGNIDVACVAKTPASGNTPESYDFGSMSAANFASLLGAFISRKVLETKGGYSASEYLLAEYSIADIIHNAHFLYFYFQQSNGINQVFKMGMLHIGGKVIREDTQISTTSSASVNLRFDISDDKIKIYARESPIIVMYRMS